MTTGCVCICCLLLVCFGDVKERVGVVVRVQHETLQVPSHFASTPLNSGVRVARCRAGDGPVDLPYVWLQVIRGACPKSERQSRMSVTRQQQSTLGHQPPHCSRRIPMLRITSLNESQQLPMLLSLPVWTHQLWRLEIIATFSSCGAGLGPLATSLRRTKWRLSRPSRVWRDHLQFSAYVSPIPSSKNNRSSLSSGIATLVLCHTRNWHALTTPGSHLSPCTPFPPRFLQCTTLQLGHPAARWASRSATRRWDQAMNDSHCSICTSKAGTAAL